MNISETVAKILLELNAISLNSKKPFRYASGILSPIYTDCRVLMAYPDKRRQIRDYYIEAIENSAASFDIVAGTATAGIPHAAWIADKLNLPMVYVRGKAKDHGKSNIMEGILNKGQKAIVIEDLVSTGESAINSVDAIRQAGGEISHVFSIITYGFTKAKQSFEENNLQLISLTTFKDVVQEAQKMNYIKKEDMQTILDWTSDPLTWGSRMSFE
ncbi:orotate phosphoribosyltransferase [Candidatus Daviesbacteria bacterium RIFCSPLOWO2_02_FULL_36_7]|uniref:Orotate phosphoribosyltransferase n=1 Tax=Candidatus Daviesbacteria bacterium RIFCSPLOWO2_02_FULL_36_7 TaxID=1797792 RepID=A0A1F5MGT7_9BACT|nr:MAG: orotate phosphoribosyltransferase [Candidatus Daviesbacteria bacterium RIFCSPLOWO2_02_FULL_36_7]